MEDGKKAAIILYKYPQPWNDLFIDTLSHEFSIQQFIYAEEIISNKGSQALIRLLNETGKAENATVIFIEVDFYPAIDSTLIRQLNFDKKVLFTLDDLVFHHRNSITAADGQCDLVITADPVSVLKYEEKMVNAQLLFHDTNIPYFDPEKLINKTNDVLFFGDISIGNRAQYVNYLTENGINIKVVGGAQGKFLTRDELTEEIRKSKIILNLSESFDGSGLRTYYSLFSPFSIYMQFKLRIVEAGLLNVACISEFAPGIGIMFNENEVRTFNNKEECLELVQEILIDDALLKSLTVNLNTAVLSKYESAALMPKVAQKVAKSTYKKIQIVIPDNYYIDTLKYRINACSNNLSLAYEELKTFKYPDPEKYGRQNRAIFVPAFKLLLKIGYQQFRKDLRKLIKF